jgi:hypothetical protein
MYQAEFIEFLSKWKTAGRYPENSVLPKTITFGPEFWRVVRSAESETKKNKVEYGFSIFAVGEKLFFSKLQKGYSDKITTTHRILIKHKQTDSKTVERKIEIDSRIVAMEKIRTGEAAKSPRIDFLFNLHTHPEHQVMGKTQYGFYSETDIATFAGNDLAVIGLVTDRLWLILKTTGSIKSLSPDIPDLLESLNNSQLLSGTGFEDLLKKTEQELGFAFYRGSLESMLHRAV